MTERDAKTFWGAMALFLAFFFIGMIIGGTIGNGTGISRGYIQGYKACLIDFKVMEE